MAAATPAPAADPVKAAEADAEALAKEEAAKAAPAVKGAEAAVEADAKAEGEGVVEEVEAFVERRFTVLKDFTAHVLTQLVSFKKGDEVVGAAGEKLLTQGAPIRVVADEAK